MTRDPYANRVGTNKTNVISIRFSFLSYNTTRAWTPKFPRRASSSTAGAPLTFPREYFQGDRGLLGESHNLDSQGGRPR